MKKLFSKKRFQSPIVSVNARLEEPDGLERLVEKLAQRDQYDINPEWQISKWEPMITSSLEGYALGDLALTTDNKLINSLFDTCFLFTCTRERERNYKVSWVCSLS